MIQDASAVAVQEQPGLVVTVSEPLPPDCGALTVVGLTVKVQPGAGCVTVNVCPPIVSVPVRALVVEFAAIVKEAVPFPEPLAPAVTVIHPTLLTAVHAQPVTAVIVADPVAPLAATDCDEGEIVGVQGAPASFTVNVLPAIVSVPLRGVVVGFAAAVNATLPAPEPDVPDVMVIHASLLTVVHEQPAGADTVTLPVPPVPATDCEAGEIVTVQVMPVCVTVNVLPAIVTVPVRVVAPV